ncbi:MAG: hypothetical protein F4073_08090 [Rhodobacteraceae bacterium]|nr:hypothetical protein [Paracoccaceae bacterium]MYI91898.1 hypothetical protein [Paracoccaceae bacterium]
MSNYSELRLDDLYAPISGGGGGGGGGSNPPASPVGCAVVSGGTGIVVGVATTAVTGNPGGSAQVGFTTAMGVYESCTSGEANGYDHEVSPNGPQP